VLAGGLNALRAQEPDRAAAGLSPPPAATEAEPHRAESVGAKTGLKIFERETAGAPESTADEPLEFLAEDATDWLGALAQLWNDWREADEEGQSSFANRDGRRLFMSRAFIRQHDTDRSGDLSCDEIPTSMENAFVHLDADHDGSLTRTEVRRHSRIARRPSSLPVESVYAWTMRANAGQMKKESLQEAYSQLRELDNDQDGKLDDNAFVAEDPKPGRPTPRQTASRGLFGRRR
jgi:hypothetical protein